jgi:peptide/nickel transport system permease protein
MVWALQRLYGALLVMLLVSVSVFFLIHLVPGDPVDVMLGESASAADRQTMTMALGLDLPLHEQLFNYFYNLLHFDLGQSIHSNQSIKDILAERLPATFGLSVAAMVFALLLALPLGVAAAVRRGSYIDRLAMITAVGGLAVPNFLLGPLLVLFFSIWLGWLPVSGFDSWQHFLLPAMTLGFSMAAVLTRMIRSTLLETLGEDYIRTAWSKGLSQGSIIWKHALRNAWLPVVTVIGAQIGALLGGAVVTETVFDWPGIGSLLIESIQKRDYPVLQACVLVISFIYVFVNAATDLLYAWLDPRVRYH